MAKGSGGSGRSGGGGGGITASNWRDKEITESPAWRAADARIRELQRSGADKAELNRLTIASAQRVQDDSNARAVLRQIDRGERAGLPWKRYAYSVQNVVQSWGGGRPQSAAEARTAAVRRLNQLWRERI